MNRDEIMNWIRNCNGKQANVYQGIKINSVERTFR